MIEKILPKKYNTHNCIENCIANLCDAENIDFRPIFLFSWDFGFTNYGYTIGEKIHYHSFFDIGFKKYFKISEEYLNIKFIILLKNKKNIIDYIKENNILLVKADSFYIPWNLAYKKYHLPHFYLLTYNKEKQYLAAIDSFSCQEIIKFDDIGINHIEQCYSIEIHQMINQATNIEFIKKKYITFLNKIFNNGVFNLFEKLGKELTAINSINKLTPDQHDIPNSILIRRMSYIANSRYNTKSFFEYIGFDQCHIETMQNIYDKWETIKNIFIKMLVSKSIKLASQANNELIQVSYLEKELCKVIIQK